MLLWDPDDKNRESQKNRRTFAVQSTSSFAPALHQSFYQLANNISSARNSAVASREEWRGCPGHKKGMLPCVSGSRKICCSRQRSQEKANFKAAHIPDAHIKSSHRNSTIRQAIIIPIWQIESDGNLTLTL